MKRRIRASIAYWWTRNPTKRLSRKPPRETSNLGEAASSGPTRPRCTRARPCLRAPGLQGILGQPQSTQRRGFPSFNSKLRVDKMRRINESVFIFKKYKTESCVGIQLDDHRPKYPDQDPPRWLVILPYQASLSDSCVAETFDMSCASRHRPYVAP